MGHKLTAIFLGQTKVRPSTPTNLVAYYPLNSSTTVNDMSGNNYHLTNGGDVNFGTYNGVDCANYNTNSNGLAGDLGFKLTSFTLNSYVLRTGGVGECWYTMFGKGQTNSMIALEWKSNNQFRMAFWGDDIAMSGTLSGNNTWYNIAVTYDDSTKLQSIYINGQLNNTRTCSNNLDLASTTFHLFTGNDTWTGPGQNFYGNLSEYMIYDKVCTATEIADHYNQTCSNYGLSPIS